MLFRKGQGMPIHMIVIIVLGIIILALILLYVLGIFTVGGGHVDSFVNASENITGNASDTVYDYLS